MKEEKNLEYCDNCGQEIEDHDGDYVNTEDTDNKDEFWCQDCLNNF